MIKESKTLILESEIEDLIEAIEHIRARALELELKIQAIQRRLGRDISLEAKSK